MSGRSLVRATSATLPVAVMVALCGCGSTGHAPSTAAGSPSPAASAGVCTAAATAAVARAASVPAGAVAESAFAPPSGAAGCRLSVGTANARRALVAVQLDTAPQAYARMERQVVETAQTVLWYHLGPAAYPQDLTGIGQDAVWFAASHQLLGTDGTRLVTVVVHSPRSTDAYQRRLAEGVARVFLTPTAVAQR